MKSFDFYDTLFTRLVAEPSTIFRLVGQACDIENFLATRLAAEREANRRDRSREISLEDIYREIKLDPSLKQRALECELRLESMLLAPIPENLQHLNDGDLIISDMYLPASVLQNALREALGEGRQPVMMLSSETGLRKADGSVWRHLVKNGSIPKLHVGDNLKADVWQAVQAGIAAEHYRGAELNSSEKALCQAGLDGEIAAGISRATRLSFTATGSGAKQNAAVVDVFSSVIAPVLLSFVEHVLQDVERLGINDLFFLARDGQLLYKMANKISNERSLNVKMHYLYASRQSLHMAGFRTVDDAAAWLLEDSRSLSFIEIASRAGLPANSFDSVARRLGLTGTDKSVRGIPQSELIRAIKVDPVAKKLAQEAERKWRVALEYYEQSGLFQGTSVALVDVGWTGRMQASLRNILDRRPGTNVDISGYYLCLSSKVKRSLSDRLVGFLHDPEVSGSACPFDPYRPVLEASLSADHGTTIAFMRTSKDVQPVLGPSPSGEYADMIQLQQNVVLDFLDKVLRVEAVLDRKLSWSHSATKDILLSMLTRPNEKQALAYRGHKLDVKQSESDLTPLIRSDFLLGDLLSFRQLPLWPEGSAVASGQVFGSTAVLLLRHIRSLVAPRTRARG